MSSSGSSRIPSAAAIAGASATTCSTSISAPRSPSTPSTSSITHRRNSAPASSACAKLAPVRSQPWNRTSSPRTPMKSACCMMQPSNVTRVSVAWRNPAIDAVASWIVTSRSSPSVTASPVRRPPVIRARHRRPPWKVTLARLASPITMSRNDGSTNLAPARSPPAISTSSRRSPVTDSSAHRASRTATADSSAPSAGRSSPGHSSSSGGRSGSAGVRSIGIVRVYARRSAGPATM